VCTDGTVRVAVFDRTSPLGRLVEAELKKKGVMTDLRRMAMKLARSNEEQDGKELLARTLVRVVDPDDDPWNPEGGHTFLAHMKVSMRQVRHRQQRRLGTAAEIHDGGVAAENTGNDGPPADDEADRSRSLAVLRMLGKEVLARLGGDRLAQQIYEAAMIEDLDPSEEEVRFHSTAAEIKAAHQRLRYHGRSGAGGRGGGAGEAAMRLRPHPRRPRRGLRRAASDT
jgi:hypothetical protein